MFEQVSYGDPSHCKTFPFVFLKVVYNFGQILKFCPPPKVQGSRVLLITAAYHDLLRRVAARNNHGRNDEEARGTISRAPNRYEGAEWLRGAEQS